MEEAGADTLPRAAGEAKRSPLQSYIIAAASQTYSRGWG